MSRNKKSAPPVRAVTVDNRAVPTDDLIGALATYVAREDSFSSLAVATARLCLMDSLGCALAALAHPMCTAHLGPVLPCASGASGGARVLGTGTILDPLKAAFDNGALIRWLDYNDTWLAAEWGHPSDNLGALLALADWRCRNPSVLGPPVLVSDLLDSMIRAYEIQGVLALANAFNRSGLDHVMLVKLACAALCARLAGGDVDAIASAISHAWVDGHALRTYRHAPNTSQRKSWAAGDAGARGMRLGLMATRCGLTTLPSALSAKQWGFADVCCAGRMPLLERALGSYVIENILFKVSFPAEFHAQTAVECAIALAARVDGRGDLVKAVRIETQESALRIIAKDGELRNYADRDHCIQYMVAVALLEGTLRAEHYADSYPGRAAADLLRKKMTVVENPEYTCSYLDPEKRSIANAVTIEFTENRPIAHRAIEYPVGHRRRREEARPLLFAKFEANASSVLGAQRATALAQLFEDADRLAPMPVAELIDLTCPH